VRRSQFVSAVASIWGSASLAFLVWSLIHHLNQGTADFTFAVAAVFPVCALAAAVEELRGHSRFAGLLLIISATSVMGFGYIGSILVFAFGLAKVIAGGLRSSTHQTQ
jgi:hypothetical protein